MRRPLEICQLGRSLQRCEENSKINLKEVFHSVVGTVQSIKLTSASWSNTAHIDTFNLYENLHTFKLYIDNYAEGTRNIAMCARQGRRLLIAVFLVSGVVLSDSDGGRHRNMSDIGLTV
jgi:hypothetical protein